MNESHCPDCLAHYTGEHTCPPWLKTLKTMNDYEHYSHRHCFDYGIVQSPCGIKLEDHKQCCLCDLPPPLKESDEKPCCEKCKFAEGFQHNHSCHTPMNESKPQDWHKGSEYERGYQEGVKAERERIFALIENLSAPYHESLLALLK